MTSSERELLQNIILMGSLAHVWNNRNKPVWRCNITFTDRLKILRTVSASGNLAGGKHAVRAIDFISLWVAEVYERWRISSIYAPISHSYLWQTTLISYSIFPRLPGLVSQFSIQHSRQPRPAGQNWSLKVKLICCPSHNLTLCFSTVHICKLGLRVVFLNLFVFLPILYLGEKRFSWVS